MGHVDGEGSVEAGQVLPLVVGDLRPLGVNLGVLVACKSMAGLRVERGTSACLQGPSLCLPAGESRHHWGCAPRARKRGPWAARLKHPPSRAAPLRFTSQRTGHPVVEIPHVAVADERHMPAGEERGNLGARAPTEVALPMLVPHPLVGQCLQRVVVGWRVG